MSNEQKLREALQAYQDANEMSPYGDYSKIEWESSAGPVNPSWGGGDCKKHGRWYGRCYSCSDEWDNLRKKADRDAYTARENALNAAKQLARQALATTEPEPTGMPELPDADVLFEDGKNQYGYTEYGHAFSFQRTKAYGEQCWKAGYKHGAWGDKPAVNQQLTTEPFDEREAFEYEMRKRCNWSPNQFIRSPFQHDDYAEQASQDAWEAWQARAAKAQGVKG